MGAPCGAPSVTAQTGGGHQRREIPKGIMGCGCLRDRVIGLRLRGVN